PLYVTRRRVIMNRTHRSALAATSLCAMLALSGHSSVSAQEIYESPSLGLRLGMGDDYKRAELAWESASLWNYRFDGGSRLDLVGELGVAYWDADGSRSPGSVWQLSATPFLRWTWSDRYYIEAGIGATVLSRTRFGGARVRPASQSGDRVAAGTCVTPNSRAALRCSHSSTAAIKRPNPGLDVLQLNYSLQY